MGKVLENNRKRKTRYGIEPENEHYMLMQGKKCGVPGGHAALFVRFWEKIICDFTCQILKNILKLL